MDPNISVTYITVCRIWIIFIYTILVENLRFSGMGNVKKVYKISVGKHEWISP